MTTTENTYFASAKKEEIGARLMPKIEQYESQELVAQIINRQFMAWRYYFGYNIDGFHGTSAVTRAGDQGELAEIRVNHSRALVNALLTLITNQKFVWIPRAVNLDYDSVRQTQLAQTILEYFWHVKKVQSYSNKAVEEAIAFSEGFVLVEWDDKAGASFPNPEDEESNLMSGDLRFTNISSWDVFRDPNKKCWDDLDWVMVRVWRNKFDLAARYPDQAEQILKIETSTVIRKSRASNQYDSDDVPLYIFYHKPCAAIPNGREVYFLDGKTVLEYNNLILDRFPLHRVAPAELTGTPYGYTQFFEILGIQELSDSVHSSIASNLSTFGTQSVTAEEGTQLQPDEMGGMRIIYHRQGGNPPAGLNLTQIPDAAFKYVEDLKKNQELLMGLNSIVRGEPQSDRLSGAAMALLQTQALQQASTLAENRVVMNQELGATVLKIIQVKASTPMKIAIVGKNKMNAVKEQEITGDMISNITSVYVEIGNPISQTAAGRVEMAASLIQMSLIKTPEQYQQVIDTGRLDPVTQATTEELTNILHENEDIAQGTPVIAMIHDNHLLHGKEHTIPVANPTARRNPAVIKAYTDHMMQHYSQFYGVPPDLVLEDPLYRERMLVLTGQTPPPPMQPPMPPPGPGQDPNAPPNQAPAQVQKFPKKEAQQPNMPQNPATKQEWNPETGGGMVTPPTE